MDDLKTNLTNDELKDVLKHTGYDVGSARTSLASMNADKEARELLWGICKLPEETNMPTVALSDEGHFVTARYEGRNGVFTSSKEYFKATEGDLDTIVDCANVITKTSEDITRGHKFVAFGGGAIGAFVGGAGAMIVDIVSNYVNTSDPKLLLAVPILAAVGAVSLYKLDKYAEKENYERIERLDLLRKNTMNIRYGHDAFEHLVAEYTHME